MRKRPRSLSLHKETLKNLTPDALGKVAAGDEITCASCRNTCVEDGCNSALLGFEA